MPIKKLYFKSEGHLFHLGSQVSHFVGSKWSKFHICIGHQYPFPLCLVTRCFTFLHSDGLEFFRMVDTL